MPMFLKAGIPVETPLNFLDFYKRFPRLRRVDKPVRIAWSPSVGRQIIGAYKRLRWGNGIGYVGWKHKSGLDSVLMNQKVFRPSFTHWGYEGFCQDFAPQLMADLIDQYDMPRGALSLVLGWIQNAHDPSDTTPHMTLALETTIGTLMACNVAGLKRFDHPWFKYHRFTYREGHPGFHQIPVGLDALVTLMQQERLAQ